MKKCCFFRMMVMGTIVGLFMSSCEETKEDLNGIDYQDDGVVVEDVVKDIDGNSYSAVKYGDQVWMAENLRVTKYSDGEEIDYLFGGLDSLDTRIEEEDYMYYVSMYNAEGPDIVLYTPHSATNKKYFRSVPVQGVCPDGWHIPNNDEWTELADYLSNNGYNYDETTGGGFDKIAKALASTSDWAYSEEEGAIGNDQSSNNASGFSAVPCGCFPAVYHGSKGNGTSFISSSFSPSDLGFSGYLSIYLDYADPDVELYEKSRLFNFSAVSVRCIRD